MTMAPDGWASVGVVWAKPVETLAQVARIARFTSKAIGLWRDLRDDEIVLHVRYHPGYGIPDAPTLEGYGWRRGSR
jgi:hypothetical protein